MATSGLTSVSPELVAVARWRKSGREVHSNLEGVNKKQESYLQRLVIGSAQYLTACLQVFHRYVHHRERIIKELLEEVRQHRGLPYR